MAPSMNQNFVFNVNTLSDKLESFVNVRDDNLYTAKILVAHEKRWAMKPCPILFNDINLYLQHYLLLHEGIHFHYIEVIVELLTFPEE